MYMVLTFWESAQERVELRFTHCDLHMMRSHKKSNVGEFVIRHVVEN